MGAESLPWASLLLVDSDQGIDLASIFADLSQSKNCSEINIARALVNLIYQVTG